MGVTLKDIADYVGLSTSSVSRVLNNKGRISEEMRKKVLKATEELNYTPNVTARELKMQRSKTIGVIIPDVTNSFYVRLLKSIDTTLWGLGYSIIFCDTDEDVGREREYFQLLKSKNVSGMIISPACKSDIYEKEIEDLNCVFVDNAPYANGKPYSFISIDNKKAAYELTQKAIDCGHKDIALIIGELEETSSKERYLGFKRCMQDNGLKVQKNRVYKGNSHFESGYKITKRLIEKRELPTCIFAHNGVEAHGVLLALKEANIRVPENISVICFDGEDNTKLIEPELTGMVQPVEEIGKIAVEMIIGNLEKSSENKTRVHLLDYYFAEGNSLAHI